MTKQYDPDPEAIADLLDRTRGHLKDKSWIRASWAVAPSTGGSGRLFDTDVISWGGSLSELGDPCGWRFCLGGALAWEALTQKTPAGKARAFMKFFARDVLVADEVAMAAVRELVITIGDDPSTSGMNVIFLTDWNDHQGRTAGQVRAMLAKTSRRLRRQAKEGKL